MKRLVSLEFDLLEDLLAYRAHAKLRTYTINRTKKLSMTCELTNEELAIAMSFNATPYFETEDEMGLIVSDIVNHSVFKKCYLRRHSDFVKE